MKHRKSLVCLSLLIGAVCLSGDSWKKCVNDCNGVLQDALSADQSTYNASVQRYAGYYSEQVLTLIRELSASPSSGAQAYRGPSRILSAFQLPAGHR